MTPNDDLRVWRWMATGETRVPAVIGKKRAEVRSVTVEYDAARGRRRRSFPNDREARRFYAKLLKADRNPKIVAARIG